MDQIKTFIKNVYVYGFGRGLRKFIGLFLMPFYTRALTPHDYGILETLGVSVFFLVAILNGYDPLTGEIFDDGSAWKHPQITNDIKNFLNSLDISKEGKSKTQKIVSNLVKSDTDFFKIEELSKFTPKNSQLNRDFNKNIKWINHLRQENKTAGNFLNHGFPASREEDELLIQMSSTGVSIKELVCFFQRSDNSIRMKLNALGISESDFPSGESEK